MGNVPGMPEMPIEDIKACAEEVMTTFVPIYTKSYALGLIEKLKMESEGKAGEGNKVQQLNAGLKLLTPPIPTDPLKEGWMTKQGAVKKSWKKRWFVATNQADNYRVYYFEKEEQKSDPKNKKGEVAPCGYKVKLLEKEEEVKEFGEHAFTLKPYGRRRQWFFRCENAEDLKDWEGVFKYACRQANAPLNPDWAMAFAFKRAYRMTRWRLGVWGWYTYDRTEEEQLGQLIVDRCEDGCMGPVYEKIPGGRLERKIRNMVQDTLDKTVGASVGAAWKVAVNGIESQKETLEKAARDVLGTLFDKEAELKAGLTEKMTSIIEPPLTELSKPVFTPICNCLMPPVVAAYVELIKSFEARMTTIIADGVKEEDIKRFVRDIRYWWGVMRPALRNIYRAFRDGWSDDEPETSSTVTITVNIGDIVDMLQGVSVWQIESQFEEDLRRLMGKAIYTFVKHREDHEDTDPTESLNAVIADMKADARSYVLLGIFEIFRLVLQPPFKRKVDPLIKSVVEPISDLIPAPLKNFLDPAKMSIEIMDDVLINCIAGSVTGGAEEAMTPLA